MSGHTVFGTTGHLSSCAADMPAKYQHDLANLNTKLIVSRLEAISS